MSTIRTVVNEPKRGCGLRKEGGLYLMADGPSAPCGKLPLPLTVCPCCGGGIKPSRGWTWVNGQVLAKDAVCKGNPDDCSRCPLDNPPERVGLLWIGEAYYPTPGAFLREAKAQGVSRRIPSIPRDFEVGTTWVWFAHRKASMKPEVPGNGIEYQAGVIGAFLPERIEYIVKGDESEADLERLERRGATLVRLIRTDGLFSEGEDE
jgi:hypothetical protein